MHIHAGQTTTSKHLITREKYTRNEEKGQSVCLHLCSCSDLDAPSASWSFCRCADFIRSFILRLETRLELLRSYRL